ncbi:MAG: benzoyl-CoA 2,3-epoxidase subunit BoxB, partial [Stellaceae bacterium]
DPQGKPISPEEWRARQYDWLPSDQDRAFVGSLMQRVTEPGKFAGWIAPPEGGINNLGPAYEYVRLD